MISRVLTDQPVKGRSAMARARLFDPDVANDHPRLERLFEQAKQDFWNESTVIDWTRPLEVPAAQLLTMVDDEQAKFALAAQVIEEAKHVSVFRRVLRKLDEIHPVDPWSRR